MFENFLKSFSGSKITGTYFGNLAFKFSIWVLGIFNIFGRVGGIRMFLGSEFGFKLYFLGNINPFEKDIFKNQIKKGDVVLDVGSHIGYYALLASQIVGDNGKVFAFEPSPDNFKILEKNLKANNCKNVTAVKLAVSNTVSKQKLYLNKNDSSEHSLHETFNGNDWNEVETTTLDAYFKDYAGKIDFIKIDVEGSEGWALLGMNTILEKNKHVKVFTEFNPSLLEKSGFGAKKYLESLVKLGFTLHYIDEYKKEITEISVDELIKKCQGGKYTNVLCVR